MRFRPLTVLLLVALFAVAGCVPSDGSPGSAGVPIMGQSRLTAGDLVAFYRSHAPASLPYRAQGATLEELAQLFVDEGNRYAVRGDIAFAQSIIETAWFDFPDSGIVKPSDNNFSGLGACGSCASGDKFGSALAGVRAQIQHLRNYADATSRAASLPDPPVPALYGSNPTTAAYNFDHFSGKGLAPTWNLMGNGNWATSTTYGTVVLGVYNRILTYSGQPGQCPPDGLQFGAPTAAGPCPVSLRQPGRAMVAIPTGGYYVLNGNGSVAAYNGAPSYGSPSFDSDLARDIAVMPAADGYVVLTGIGVVFKFGSAAAPDKLGPLPNPYFPGNDIARAIAITPDGKGYVVLDGHGTVWKFGTAATGPLAALASPSWPADDVARSIAVTPDGQGYVVLDNFGGVWKYGTAAQGAVGSGATRYLGADIARDIVLVSLFGQSIGYYVLDGRGNIWSTAGVPAAKDLGVLTADRWRAITIFGGRPFALKNDGTTGAA
jgi:hypothetical protein